jgi:hypothetical protein
MICTYIGQIPNNLPATDPSFDTYQLITIIYNNLLIIIIQIIGLQ